MNAWATTIISGLVFVVAFMQWRTAHMKVVLDLFDRRMRVYSALEEGLLDFTVSRGQSAVGVAKILEAFFEAKFLFGADVFGQIHELAKKTQAWKPIPPEIAIYDPAKREEMRLQQDSIMTFAEEFRASMPNLFERYMRMDQKLVRTPWQWFGDRNRIRLSYADEKQR